MPLRIAKLVYPILLVYSEDAKGYDENIKKVPQYIKDNLKSQNINISIEYSIFFILIPLKKVKEIKTNVIQWIESQKPLMS